MLATALMLLACAMPAIVFAQAQDIHTTIRAVLQSDPRTSALTEQEVEAIVAALEDAATERGIEANDILWRPEADYGASLITSVETVPSDCSANDALCALNAAFGFSGSDRTIPILLGFSSAALLILIAVLIEIHRMQKKKQRAKVVA